MLIYNCIMFMSIPYLFLSYEKLAKPAINSPSDRP